MRINWSNGKVPSSYYVGGVIGGADYINRSNAFMPPLPLYLGNILIATIYLGSTSITSIYLGSTKVF